MSKGLATTIDALSALFAAAAAGIVGASWTALPERIPTHFNLRGEPDGWGGKGTLLFVAVICAGLFAALSAAPHYPNLINVPGERTEYKIRVSIDMLRALKLVTMAMMTWIVWGMTHQQGLGLSMFGFIAAIFVVLGFGFYKMSQDAR
jgi:uncharacterized membrane protein